MTRVSASDTLAELLAEARSQIHLPDELDTAGRIAAANLAFGLARLQNALGTLHPGARTTFTGSPDFTITRTVQRWRGGFAYGGILTLEPAGLGVVIPELRPNACGTLVGRLTGPAAGTMTAEALIERASKVRAESADAVWDYSRRNHFINLYRDSESGEQYFIVHGCPARIRFDSAHGPGLDYRRSEHWQPRIETVATPLGTLDLLVGADAESFWRNFLRCEALSIADRQHTAERIFGDFEVVQNTSHVGMAGRDAYYYGCHVNCPPGTLYPVLTRPGAPAFLVEAVPGADGHVPPLPHGTGYHLDLPEELTVTFDASGQRPVFLLGNANEGAQQAYGELSGVPFRYRSETLVDTWHQQGLLNIRQTLDMVATLKL